jgi:nucleotide-binding universal stress UspA family protein
MYEAIVVGTDGSKRADRAVDEAISLAKLSGAKLYGVHVIRPLSTMGSEFEASAIALDNQARQEESERIQKDLLARAKDQGVTVEIQTFDGDPATALFNVAESVNANLIVVGNRGMTGVKRFVLGSVPNKVAHGSTCSVLIVNTDRT